MKFYGELITFILLFITNFRVFFVRHTKTDPLASLAPISFCIAILQVIAWGFDLFTGLALFISFLVLLSNFHALFRYSENLYIDHYSPLMKFWAIFTSILSVFAIIFNLLFYPVELNNHKLGIKETLINKTGTFRTGFEDAKPFSFTKVFITEFKKNPLSQLHNPNNKNFTNTYQINTTENTDNQNIVIFISDKRADTQYYKPFLQLLAKEGHTIYSADFFCNDSKWFHNIADSKPFRRFFLCAQSVLTSQQFNSQRELYTYNISQELKAITNILSQKYQNKCKFFIITDVMGKTALSDFEKSNSEKIIGTFCLDSVSEYKTAGYGCVEQTDPFLAKILGTKKESDLFITKYLVLRTNQAIQNAINQAEKN